MYLNNDMSDLRRTDNLWVENYLGLGIIAYPNLPTFMFKDGLPRRNISIYVTYPYAGAGLSGSFIASSDGINWAGIGGIQNFTGGPAMQIFKLNNKGPIPMLNFDCTNGPGVSTICSLWVDGTL